MKKDSKKNIISIIFLIILAVICFIVIDFMRDQKKTQSVNVDLVDQINLELIESRFGVGLFGIPDDKISDFSTISDSLKFYMTTLGNGFQFDRYTEDEGSPYKCGGYSLNYFDQQFRLLFGGELVFNHDNKLERIDTMEHVREITKFNIENINFQKKEQVFLINQCSDNVTDYRLFYKWSNIKIEKDRLIVTAKALFGYYDKSNSKLILYKDSAYKEKLTEFPTSEINQSDRYTILPDSDNMKVMDYYNQSYTYQYTFSNDGKYYLRNYTRIK